MAYITMHCIHLFCMSTGEHRVKYLYRVISFLMHFSLNSKKVGEPLLHFFVSFASPRNIQFSCGMLMWSHLCVLESFSLSRHNFISNGCAQAWGMTWGIILRKFLCEYFFQTKAHLLFIWPQITIMLHGSIWRPSFNGWLLGQQQKLLNEVHYESFFPLLFMLHLTSFLFCYKCAFDSCFGVLVLNWSWRGTRWKSNFNLYLSWNIFTWPQRDSIIIQL